MEPCPAPSAESRKVTRWGDLKPRILSAAVLAPLALGCIWIGGVAFAGLVALITVGLAFEWIGLCRQPVASFTTAIFAVLPLSVGLAAAGTMVGAIGLLTIAAIGGVVLANGAGRTRLLAFGIPYLGFGPVALVWLRQPPVAGGVNVIVLLLVVWASDIGAYLAGRALGGPRLAPTISPGKTWSGAIGALVAAAGVGFAAATLLGHGAGFWRAVGFAVLIGCVSQAGDLFESQLKRHFGVKDSGRLIPGHGGLLDRLDALLAAAPAAALLALILGRGVILWQ